MHCRSRASWQSLIALALLEFIAPAGRIWAISLPIHAYDFNGSFADNGTAGVAITSEGGTVGASLYAMDPQLPSAGGDANQGLTLTTPSLSDSGVYSIEMYLMYESVRSISDEHWIKLIDFKDGAEALGVYYEDMPFSTRFDPVPAEPGVASLIKSAYTNPLPGPPGVAQSTGPLMTAGEWNHVVATRDAGGLFTCYVDGVAVYSYQDAEDDAVFTGPGGVMRFLQNDAIDDSYNYFNSAKGAVDFLNVYNESLSAGDVATLAAAVPEPTSAALAIAASMLAVLRRNAVKRT